MSGDRFTDPDPADPADPEFKQKWEAAMKSHDPQIIREGWPTGILTIPEQRENWETRVLAIAIALAAFVLILSVTFAVVYRLIDWAVH